MKTLLTLLLILSNPMPVGSNCCHYGTAHTHSHIDCCRNLSSNSNRNIGNFPDITAQWYQHYINNNIYDENNARLKILNDIITFGSMIETTKYDRKYKNLIEKLRKWDESWNSWIEYDRKMQALLEEEKQFENSSEESDLNSNIDRYT
ncbi:MAG: hypothetical protein NQ127_04620, partial [Candidatus Cardinium sp.]|nr:hypothetical protein [Candidatus Cardinium sp.]